MEITSLTNDALKINVNSQKDILIESLKEEINFLRHKSNHKIE